MMEENKNVNPEEVKEEVKEVDLEETELTEEETESVGGGKTFNIFGIC